MQPPDYEKHHHHGNIIPPDMFLGGKFSKEVVLGVGLGLLVPFESWVKKIL
jgi:hypothetical protein